MQYFKFTPCAFLQTYIECYFVWQSAPGEVINQVIESPPTGFCSVMFNLADAYQLQTKKYERLQPPQYFLSGQTIYSYKLFLNGAVNMAGIVFKPAALATIFNLPMHEFVEERIDLYKLFKQTAVDEMVHKLKTVTQPEAVAQELESFVLAKCRQQPPEPDYIDEAANFILDNNGILDVNDLVQKSCMSRRTFERRFFQKVGLSPKYYCRIRRIGMILKLIAGKKKADWAKLFYECEFYDQAHFIKDFIEFTGRTPQQYLQENTELANYVNKPDVQQL